MLEDLWAARYLAWRIMLRDLSARYRQTLLGFLWIFLPPLFVAVGMSLATRAQVIRIAATDIPYPAYVIFCMALWQTFAESVNAPLTAIFESRAVLAKIDFPREALILARLGDVLISFTVRMLLVVVVFIWYEVSVPIGGLASVPAALPLIVFGFGLGLLLGPFATLYQDVSKGVPVIMGIWLFVTPVVYPLPQGDDLFSKIVRHNPVTPLLVTVKEIATGVPTTFPYAYVGLACGSVLLVLLAWVVYKIALPFVIERLSA